MTIPGGTCPGADHRPPVTGGSCGCGMVTSVVPRQPRHEAGAREVLARLFADALSPAGDAGRAAGDPGAAGSARQQAEQLLAALDRAGFVVRPRERARLLG